MKSSGRAALARQAFAVLLILLVISAVVGLTITLLIISEYAIFDIATMAIGFAVLAVPFVAGGILLVGIPALLMARRTRMNISILRLCTVGIVTGAIAAPAVMLIVSLASGRHGWQILAAIGTGCGLVAAILWWHLIEKQILMETRNV